MKLEQLPGVGPGVASAIRRAFGDDAKFFAAAEASDLQALTEVEGISERKAVDLIHAIRGDDTSETILATPATRQIHERIIAAIQSHAGTRLGRNRLRLLAPLPDPAEAQARMQHVLRLKDEVAKLDQGAIRKEMRHLRPLQQPTPRCDTTRLVVAENDDVYERLHGLGIGSWSILGTRRDLGMAGDMDIVIVAYDDGMDLPDLDAIEEVPAHAPLCDLAPEAVLRWVDANRSVLAAADRLAELTGRASVAGDILAASQALQVPRIDARGLDPAIEAALQHADTAIGTALADLQLSGTELLTIMQGGALPTPVRTAIDVALADARTHLREATGFTIDPFQDGLPLRLDEVAVERARRRIETEGRMRREHAERKTARAIATHQETFAAEVAHWLEWDADFALGSFAASHGLQTWTPGDRLAIQDGVHLDFTDGGQRITYHVGDPAIAILTGANSGGKSTLLEQLCQVVLMARLGLPVVGQATIPWVDEIHLVTARRGLDAGAFETFLRAFMPASLGGAKRLVLADEVESVTELEAAGRILAFFVERLLETDSMAVIVSHVPHAILEHLAPGAVRVDGIEAKGLDEHNRLVVDRQPVLGRLARSTPELIVQRLAKTTRGAEQGMYERLAACLHSETRKNPA